VWGGVVDDNRGIELPSRCEVRPRFFTRVLFVNSVQSAERTPLDLASLDALTGGALTATTAAERADKVKQWLATDPELDRVQEAFRELSHRDRGATKPLKDRIDELKRVRHQDQLALEWAAKAQALLDATRFSLGDALAWQRDAAAAGAPLSKEPLAAQRVALAERIRQLEEIQHKTQVQKESAWLLVQRIEVLSTKPWSEASQAREALSSDVLAWQQDSGSLKLSAMWGSVEPRLMSQLDSALQQVSVVWGAFESALAQAAAASADAALPLPGVPVWDDEIRLLRKVPGSDSADAQINQEQREQAQKEALQALAALEKEMAAGHGKAVTRLAQELRQLVKAMGRRLDSDTEGKIHAVLAQAGELEGWQRWRADQLREKLVQQAEALLQLPAGQRPGGRKLQENLRQMREQWKSTDQGGVPNHALWKRFDEACNALYKDVEAWLAQLRQQNDASKAQRVALMDEVRTWVAQASGQTEMDWKGYARQMQAFGERWRQSGHLSEKLFTDMQAQWKKLMHEAQGPLDKIQGESVARRQAFIAEAQALAQEPVLRIDAVRELQHRWQAEAQTVPLERRHEQKLWDAFRGPIDAAFKRKDEVRQAQRQALSAHDQRVLDAATALERAAEQGDAAAIHAARQALERAFDASAVEAPVAAAPVAAPVAEAPVPATDNVEAAVQADGDAVDSPESGEAPAAAPAEAPAPVAPAPVVRKLVAVRGDDRPGGKLQPTARAPEASGRDRKPLPRRDARDGMQDRRAPYVERPRLGDAAFRAQRQALEKADMVLRRLASQAHGEVLMGVLQAWESRQADQMPAIQGLAPAHRQAWIQALQSSPAAANDTLLRLEMAAELPSPADKLNERRQLQLLLLTRRNDPAPAQTWPQDVARLLGSAHDADSARRLQSVLKVLLGRR
jgi:ATP-dependent RNA helicase SUPV3L1/SUV3